MDATAEGDFKRRQSRIKRFGELDISEVIDNGIEIGAVLRAVFGQPWCRNASLEFCKQ